MKTIFLQSILILLALTSCGKLGDRGSLETDITASVSEDDVKIILDRIVGEPQSEYEVLVTNDDLIFFVKSKRAREVKYTFEKTDAATCGGSYSNWLDVRKQISLPIVAGDGKYKLCLLGRFGPREGTIENVYDITVQIAPEE